MSEKGSAAPEERSHDFWDVVEVSSQSPPATGKQQRGSFFAILGDVLSDDVVRLLAPHLSLSVGVSEFLTLTINNRKKEEEL